jgi:hypothetical protein
MLVQDERGRFLGLADRRDCLDDLSRFREAVGDSDGLAAVTFAENDFPARRNSAFGHLPDCQSTEANEKIVGLIAFVPGGIEDRDEVATTLSSLGRATYPR